MQIGSKDGALPHYCGTFPPSALRTGQATPRGIRLASAILSTPRRHLATLPHGVADDNPHTTIWVVAPGLTVSPAPALACAPAVSRVDGDGGLPAWDSSGHSVGTDRRTVPAGRVAARSYVPRPMTSS